MAETLRKRDRLIYGVLLPIVVMIAGLFVIRMLKPVQPPRNLQRSESSWVR